MNNAAFLPLPKDVFRAVGISAFVGVFSGFALTHTLQGAILGAIGVPIGVGVLVGLFVGGFYLWEEAIPNGWRKFKFRHLKMGATEGWMMEIQKGGSEDELCHLVGCAYYARAKITLTYGADSAFAILSKEVTVAIHAHLICLAGGHESQILEMMNDNHETDRA